MANDVDIPQLFVHFFISLPETVIHMCCSHRIAVTQSHHVVLLVVDLDIIKYGHEPNSHNFHLIKINQKDTHITTRPCPSIHQK